ncbi:hypothetical protein ACFZBU_39505 [Embleya sp. NPDC008237]|uniref:hypothetical protein n=1 Tax=Embleya sp. NPDC008237 TaxID=3363978 RepID=UPI0036E1C8AE
MVADVADLIQRRERRLLNQKHQRHALVLETLRRVWEQGRRPDSIRLRHEFVLGGDGVAPPLSRLMRSRGSALRFYLLAIFDAQCRLAIGESVSPNTRPLNGGGQVDGWADFISIDAAYDGVTGTYLRSTKQTRTETTARLRQVQGALRTLEQEHLVLIPTKPSKGDRDYGRFQLLSDDSRGNRPTPHVYRVPSSGLLRPLVPRDFFLHGWVHVLSPSEIVTWLVLRLLRKRFPDSHDESGVFLYADAREGQFGLKRDAYEDGCAMLQRLGLIRRASKHTALEALTWETLYQQPNRPQRYEPYRYQLTDEGLAQDAMASCLKVLVLEKKRLAERARDRADAENEVP